LVGVWVEKLEKCCRNQQIKEALKPGEVLSMLAQLATKGGGGHQRTGYWINMSRKRTMLELQIREDVSHPLKWVATGWGFTHESKMTWGSLGEAKERERMALQTKK
jgi:hypothetical protein